MQSITDSYEASMKNMKDEHVAYRDIVEKLNQEK